MKLRPLFILADLDAGGAQRVMLTVVRHLNRERFDPHLAIIRSTGPLLKELPEDIPIHHLNTGRVRYTLPGILRLCRSLKPETLVSTLGHLNLLILAGKWLFPKGTCLLVREANTPSIRLQYTGHPWLYRFFYRVLYPLADGIICNSHFMKRDMQEHFGIHNKKITVIPNPVDTKRIRQEADSAGNPYEEGKFHIVSVGRLNYQKGFDLLLKAFERSLERAPNLYLTIVGDGPERGVLEKSVRDAGITDSVCFTGHRDNPFGYMAHADISISSSRWEGLPNVVLESLACGTPVIAFDCPGGTGEIIKEGENGWLIPSGDWRKMGEKIVEITKNEEALKQMRNRSLLPDEFYVLRVVKEFEALLKTLANNDSGGPR